MRHQCKVLEETGYNLCGKIQRQHRIDLCVKQQPVTLFVVPGIPENFVFRTQTRKEISVCLFFSITPCHLTSLVFGRKSTGSD